MQLIKPEQAPDAESGFFRNASKCPWQFPKSAAKVRCFGWTHRDGLRCFDFTDCVEMGEDTDDFRSCSECGGLHADQRRT